MEPFIPSEAVLRKIEEAERLEDQARELQRQAVGVASRDEIIRLYQESTLARIKANNCREDGKILEEREKAAHERRCLLEARGQPRANETGKPKERKNP